MKRRAFIKNSCSLCLLLGAGVAISSLASCATTGVFKTEVKENKVSVPVTLFADSKFQILRPRDYDYDVALEKQDDGTYHALLLKCTHAANPVAHEGNGFYCNLHGSAFDIQGNVTHGPAENPLKQLRTTVISDQIIIQLI